MNSTTEKLFALRVIPVLRLATRPDAESAIECLIEAGFKTVELTLTTPGAIALIASLRRRTGEDFWSAPEPCSTSTLREPVWKPGRTTLFPPAC